MLALITAAQYIRTGVYRRVLVVGGDAMSRVTDYTDRGTCILFGDGCGAVVVTGGAEEPCGLLGFDMHSDGEGGQNLHAKFSGVAGKPTATNGGASSHTSYANVSMVRPRPWTLCQQLHSKPLTLHPVPTSPW